VIAFSHGEKLFTAANEPKTFFPVNGAGHNDVECLAGEAYWQAIRTFAESVK